MGDQKNVGYNKRGCSTGCCRGPAALGSVTKKLGKWIEKLGIRVRIGPLQKTTLLGTARILYFKEGS